MIDCIAPRLLAQLFFYLAGLGTGLHVARTTVRVRTICCGVCAGHRGGVATPSTSAVACAEARRMPLASFGRPGISWRATFTATCRTESELPYAAIEGVIDATGDPYTAFLDPLRAEILKTDLQGGFEGIGATVRLRPDGLLEIVQPLPGWPADQAGLRAGDAVIEVDGVASSGDDAL